MSHVQSVFISGMLKPPSSLNSEPVLSDVIFSVSYGVRVSFTRQFAFQSQVNKLHWGILFEGERWGMGGKEIPYFDPQLSQKPREAKSPP